MSHGLVEKAPSVLAQGLVELSGLSKWVQWQLVDVIYGGGARQG